MSEPNRTESDSPSEEEREDGMDFWEHLRELRQRIVISTTAIAICAILGWYLSEEAFTFLVQPFHNQFHDATLIGTGPAEAFILRLKVSIFLGALFASPLLFFQIWLFIAPGLLEEERRLAIPFVFFTTFLFLTGTTFCFAVVLPFALDFFRGQYAVLGDISPTIRVSEYLSLLIKALLGFGLVFETPIFAFFLGRLGLVTAEMLISGGRYAIIGIFVISAILTPPDILTQFLMAGPLLILYGISILIVRWTERTEAADDKRAP